MESLKNFGFDPMLFVAQIINFLVILYVLKRFMYKPVLEMLKKRQKTIESGIKNSQDAEQKLIMADKKEKETLKRARDQAEKIVHDARNQASEIKSQAHESAKKEAERLINDARQTIDQE